MAERQPLRRFAEEAPGAGLDARLGRLFRGLPEPNALSAEELREVRLRFDRPGSGRARTGVRYALLLSAGMLAGTGFAVASYGVSVLLRDDAPEVPPAAPPDALSPSSVAPPPRRAPPPATPSAKPPPARESGAAPAPAPDDALGREAELMSRALTALRRERDPERALSLLDRHRALFPKGALSAEADLARLDALLALGRKSEALALLERLPIDRSGRGAELRVVRAELRAPEAPAGALSDFDRALASGVSGALEERALIGRAGVSLRLGDRASARADLERYLERYPGGRFAEQARRELAR